MSKETTTPTAGGKLAARYGLRLELSEELSKSRSAQNWLDQVSDMIAEELERHHISLVSLELPTNQPTEIITVKSDPTLEKFERAKQLWVNVAAGRLEIGTEVLLKGKENVVIDGVTRRVSKSKGQKFVMNQVSAEQLGHHILRLAADMR